MGAGQVRFVYRHLAFIGTESVRAAEAAECASAQDRFWEYHDVLFENWAGENVGAFSDSNLVGFAAQVGLDAKKFSDCLESGQYRQRVTADAEAADALNVRTTPTIFINGRRVTGLQDFGVYRGIIEEELAKAR